MLEDRHCVRSTDLQEGVTDSCHVVLRRITRDDQAFHDLDQVWDCLRYTQHKHVAPQTDAIHK